jgi:DNA replication protein DnaC
MIERWCDERRKGGKHATAKRAVICLNLILKEAVRRGFGFGERNLDRIIHHAHRIDLKGPSLRGQLEVPSDE